MLFWKYSRLNPSIRIYCSYLGHPSESGLPVQHVGGSVLHVIRCLQDRDILFHLPNEDTASPLLRCEEVFHEPRIMPR